MSMEATDEQKPDTAKISIGTVVLALAVKILQEVKRKQRFAVLATGAAAATPQQIMPATSQGVVKCVHNPTNAAITVTIVSDSNPGAQPLFSQSIPANSTQPAFLPFYHGLLCIAGSGCIVAGEVD